MDELQKIEITSVMGGDKYRVDDPNYVNPKTNKKGRFEFRASKAEAKKLKQKWSKEYGDAFLRTPREGSDDKMSKSAIIRDMIDEGRLNIKQIAVESRARYQMVWNIAKKYKPEWLDKQAELKAVKGVSGEPDAGTEPEEDEDGV